MTQEQPFVEIRPWAEGDLPLLNQIRGYSMFMEGAHIGGPERPEQVRERHTRYLNLAQSGTGCMFAIVVGSEAVGVVGYWERERQGEMIWEAEVSVLSEFWRGNTASQTMRLIIAHGQANGKHRFMHAFPSIHIIHSNVVYESVGFALQGEVEFEYPIGHMLCCNDWRLDLLPVETTDVN